MGLALEGSLSVGSTVVIGVGGDEKETAQSICLPEAGSSYPLRFPIDNKGIFDEL